jgi:hypothetical protein
VTGGTNAKPSRNCETEVDRGKGGTIDMMCINNGTDGEDGQITFPSQLMANAGNGGSTSFNKGGEGGTNYFANGGNGGDRSNMIGSNGMVGSGGGGSVARLNLDFTQRTSGDGGDGFILIEY